MLISAKLEIEISR